MTSYRQPQSGTSGLSPDPSEWFRSLFNAHFDHVYNYARARVGPHEGEDVAADCFHAAAIAYRDGRAEQVTRAWLFSVAHNKVIDRWRRASTQRTKAHLLTAPLNDDDGFPSTLDTASTRDAVIKALDQLNHRHRALLILHHVDGAPTREIAAQMGMTPAAIDSALARARRAFRRHYRPPEEQR